ncbi:MAG: S1C family serine protease, partial [Oscillospiraceae bacterium]|nr:S1C family serine protease [Oscillospiraceae bacterium]
SDYPLGMLQVRESSEDTADALSHSDRISTQDASRTTLLASVVVRVYGSDGLLPDVVCYGVLMEENGYIVTSAAVVRDESLIEVEMYNGSRLRARLIGYDLKTDIAVVKVDGRNLRTAVFGNGDMTKGDLFIYISLGQNGIINISEGIFGGTSGLYVDTPAGSSYLKITVTDRFSSDVYLGGVVVNSAGQIIGLRCSLLSDSFHSVYALSINDVRDVINGIINDGYVKNRYTLAFRGESVSEVLADSRGIPLGVAVVRIESASDLLKQGVAEGDIITEAAGIKVTTVEELEEALAAQQSFEVVLRIFRPSDKKDFEVTVQKLEDTGLYTHS